jgi:hypothetical protein
MSTVIIPTVGRMVIFRCEGYGYQEQAAIVAHINEDGTLNLTASDPLGQSYPVQNVPLLQEADFEKAPTLGLQRYAHWMPYQIKVAAKEE